MKSSLLLVASTLWVGFAIGCQAPSEDPAESQPQVAVPEPTDPEVAGPEDLAEPLQPAVPAVEDGVAASSPQDKQDGEFDVGAFPPTVPDTEWHADAWWHNDCMRCHETGVGDAPELAHRGMSPILIEAKCRTCHVLIPGSKPRGAKVASVEFEANAFPPMIPASRSHPTAWFKDDCLLCHEEGTKGAPKLVHQGLPPVLRTAKCRTCHVQVRSVDSFGELR